MLLFLITVWAGDTGAYSLGSRYGKRKLYPVISPKKTVEGAIGGIGSGFVIALIYKLLLFRSLSWGGAIFIPVLIGAVSQVGDLCESFFKRAFDRKDSGSILPGHGGFLDRFDGVVFSLPIMYGCMRIFG
jgi:phosphatidate cytidylyltransferase